MQPAELAAQFLKREQAFITPRGPAKNLPDL